MNLFPGLQLRFRRWRHHREMLRFRLEVDKQLEKMGWK